MNINAHNADPITPNIKNPIHETTKGNINALSTFWLAAIIAITPDNNDANTAISINVIEMDDKILKYSRISILLNIYIVVIMTTISLTTISDTNLRQHAVFFY
ncbi:hypothetical protein GCM10027180_19330 [Microbulbifer echini]